MRRAGGTPVVDQLGCVRACVCYNDSPPLPRRVPHRHGCAYTPAVAYFRTGASAGYAFEHPHHIASIACAAYVKPTTRGAKLGAKEEARRTIIRFQHLRRICPRVVDVMTACLLLAIYRAVRPRRVGATFKCTPCMHRRVRA